jgi:rhamnosyltransferase
MTVESLITIFNMIIHESYNGLKTNSEKACLFASWDPTGKVDPYVFHYLNEIKKQGFDIYFCTTSESEIIEIDLINLKKICVKIIRRENIGIDFYSWKTCFDLIPGNFYNEILLTNDSNYGPTRSLKNEFDKIKNIDCDVIGLIDSYEIQYHIQSFFIYFKNNGLKKLLPDFFKSFPMLPTNDKVEFIKQFELGLSEKIIFDGYDIASIYDYEMVVEKALSLNKGFYYHTKIREKNINPTTEMWRVLIKDFDYPFLKKELILPKKTLVNHLLEEVNFTEVFKDNKEIINLINNHIKRVKK